MKKRTLAILLTALLVVSVVFVLAACQKEYTVTFRDTSGRELDTVTTVKGKATATEKATTKAGYTFEDWYKTIGQDDDGNYTYTDKVDLATYEFTEDTDLYAKWKRNITAGEDAGYCIIGKITGLSEEWENGGFDPEAAMNEPKAQLTHATDPINLYSITLDVKALDSFKIKTNSAGWSNIEINGLSPLLDKGSVTLKSGVTLPEGVNKASDLFTYTYGIDNNVSPKCDMNITINFYYNASESYADLIVNSIDGELVKPVEEVGYAIAGSMNMSGTGWKEYFTAAEIEEDSTLAQYVFKADAEKKSFTTTVVLHRNDSFQIKVNENGWSRGQYGADAIESVTYDENLDEAKKPDSDARVAFSTSGNITVNYDLTAIITITADGGATSTNGKITIVITDIDPTAPTPDNELGIVLTGAITGDPEKMQNWAKNDPNFKLTANADNTVFTIENVKFSANDQFKFKVFIPQDTTYWGYHGENLTVVLGEGVTGETTDFVADASGNIKILKTCTATIVFNYNEEDPANSSTYTITITEYDANEVVTPDNELGIVLTGTINGNPEKTQNWAKNDPNFKLTANADNTVFTIEGVQFAANNAFKFKVFVPSDTTYWGYHGENLTVVLGEGVTGETTDYVADDCGNIKILKACTATIVFNYNTENAAEESTYTITITADNEETDPDPDEGETTDPTPTDPDEGEGSEEPTTPGEGGDVTEPTTPTTPDEGTTDGNEEAADADVE